MGIVILVLFAGPLPTSVPSFSGLITNDSKTIYISHEGGDPLRRGQYKILVDGVDRTSSFVGPDPLTLGKNLSYTPPSMNASRVVMIFNTSWGGGTVLLSADLARRINLAPYGWYNGDWLYRKKITIDHTKVAADQTDFPVLISKQDGDLSQGMGKARTDANDILFTSSNGMTKLPHEIENFTSNNGAFVTWVKVPSLSSTTDTVIYLYYGNLGASSQQSPAAVWDTNYKGVWHLKEATGFNNADSTIYANTGTPQNSTPQVPGQMDGSLNFNPATMQHVAVPDSASLELSTSMTVSGWMKTGLTDTQSRLIAAKWKTGGSYKKNYWLGKLYGWGGNHWVSLNVNSTEYIIWPWNLADSAWHYVVGVADAPSHKLYLYVDGSQVNNTYYTGFSETSTSPDLNIGKSPDANQQLWNGGLDEIRISSTPRSPQWIQTEYNNQNSPGTFILSISSEQTQTSMS
jgi:hypothetical protein